MAKGWLTNFGGSMYNKVNSTLTGKFGVKTGGALMETGMNAITGAGFGALGGGIYGATNENEGIIGGALKGAGIGAATGATMGIYGNRENFGGLKDGIKSTVAEW